MEGKAQGVIGGLSGAALLAVLFAGQGKVASNTPVNSAPGNTRPTGVGSLETQHTGLDQNGPWSAVCEEFLSGLDERLQSPVVSVDTVPKGAEPGATEVNIRKGDFESIVPVHNYPVNPNLTACVGTHQRLRAMIVTVPDPVRSHMQLEFDRSVTGIVRGAGADDFSLQRYWFPWTPNSATQEQSTEREYQARLRLSQPAVLIFRHTELHQDERLVVFLVSETPTAGVNREQFSIAVKYVRQLQPGDDSQIRIAGPRFSASLPILEELIKALVPKAESTKGGDSQPYRNVSVYSPSTTHDVLMKRFGNELPGVDFLTFQVRDNDTLKQLVEILHRMSYKDEEIATLSEDESAYGVGQEPEDETSPTNPPAHESIRQQDGDDSVPPRRLLRLQFPRDLSAVRNAIEEQNPQLEASRELGIPLLSVPLSLHEEPQNEHDSPPPYATAQAAADLDRELQSLVARIRENNIQAVLVMASNPLDRLFLLDYLHAMLPDVRLVTAESDTLMLKRPGYVDLSGTLVLSGVPLLPDSRAAVWHQEVIDPAESSAAEFRSTGEESVFLSVWSLLVSGKNEKRVEHPGEILRPCEFLSVVGADRFLLANTHGPQPFFPCVIDRPNIGVVTQHLESVPRSWKVFVLVLSLASLVHLLLVNYNVLVAEKQQTTSSQNWSFRLKDVVQSGFQNMFRWELYRVVPDLLPGPALVTTGIYPKEKSAPDFVSEKLLLLFVLTNQLFLFSYMAFRTTWVAWLPLHDGDRILGFDPVIPQLGMLCLCSLLPAMLFVTSARLFGRLCWRLKFNPKRGLIWQGIVATSFVGWTVRTWEYLLRSGNGTPDWGVAYRSIQVFAGLSPLAAIGAVLVGYIGFTLTHLRRVEHIQNRKVHLDFAVNPDATDEASESAKRITNLQNDIHRSIETALSHPALQVIFFVLPCVFLLRVFVALRGIEISARGSHFSPWSLTFWSIFWGFLALLTFIAFSLYQNWYMWTRVRALLQHLNFSPIRDVFAGLASDTTSMQIWKIGGDRRSLVLQYRTLELLQRMAVIRVQVVNGPTQILPDQTLHAELDLLAAKLYERERCDQTMGWKDHTTVAQISKVLNAKLAEAKFLLGHSGASDDQPLDEQTGRYLGLRIAALLRYSLIQIRNMLWFGLWGFVFLLLSVRLYPFQGRHTLSMLMSFLFLTLLLAIGAMFAQMESDPILSKLQDSEATASGSFLRAASKLVAVGGVPLLAVIASQFPAFAAFISGWIKPISESLR